MERMPITWRSPSPPWRLEGRDRELKILQRAAHQPGTAGIILTGIPGAGTTRLALEMLGWARSAGLTTAWVAASRPARSIPLGSFAHLLRGAVEAPTGSLGFFSNAVSSDADPAC